ncbi:MAG: hypothetical protein WBA46_08760, partial [Thermomicrobiales bacterium]
IAPYTRFVRASQAKLEHLDSELGGIRNDLRALRREIGGEDIAAVSPSDREETPQLPAEVGSGDGGASRPSR